MIGTERTRMSRDPNMRGRHPTGNRLFLVARKSQVGGRIMKKKKKSRGKRDCVRRQRIFSKDARKKKKRDTNAGAVETREERKQATSAAFTEDLPAEMVVAILKAVETVDGPACRRVCRLWRALWAQGRRGRGCRTSHKYCSKRDYMGTMAKRGRLKTLRWARTSGCPWTCDAAAANGHLKVLRWARAPTGAHGTSGHAPGRRQTAI